ncbi:response regulator transcription factor [Chitinispirillales bacterium ANBcel5]|uniref:response regulator n=1 Tax=Cellulosispirillum alkaliphilum TaxID=3039283 RepID=UPI002A58B3A0|nr:response regulator transcription factor [Chitinispirillales bacterium ANBcel5]
MKVYIVEDDNSMRFILKRLLRKNFSSITAIGESEDAEQALREIPSFAPDIVLVDISLPGIDGIEMIRRLKPQHPNLCMLVVTCHDIDLYRQTALNAGVCGIVSKMDDDELLRAVGGLFDRCKKGDCN